MLDKNSQNAVNNASKELRRNYSKKVADKLAHLTKTSLKILSKHFASASAGKAKFLAFVLNVIFLCRHFREQGL